MEFTQKRIQELEKKCSESSKHFELKSIAEQLEQKLTDCETQLLTAKENENKLRRELLVLEKENMDLKQEVK